MTIPRFPGQSRSFSNKQLRYRYEKESCWPGERLAGLEDAEGRVQLARVLACMELAAAHAGATGERGVPEPDLMRELLRATASGSSLITEHTVRFLVPVTTRVALYETGVAPSDSCYLSLSASPEPGSAALPAGSPGWILDLPGRAYCSENCAGCPYPSATPVIGCFELDADKRVKEVHEVRWVDMSNLDRVVA